MYQFVLLLAGVGFILASNAQVDSHRVAMERQIEEGSLDRALMAYDCSGPLHQFHYLEEIGIATLAFFAVLAVVARLGESDAFGILWRTLIVPLVLLGVLSIGFEFLLDGMESQTQGFSIDYGQTIQIAAILDLGLLACFVALFWLGPPERFLPEWDAA